MSSRDQKVTRYSQDEILNLVLRNDFASFVRMAFVTVSPGDSYSANWHIEAICHELSKVKRGETKRLIITIPPRHLKSICTSVALPAFVLGHDPTRRIICVSYSQELAVKHANDCRTVMNSDWYRRAFPGTKVDPGKNTETEVMTTQRGFRLSTSVGGTLTGRGGNFIIIDDPIKPTDAMSDTTRERLVQWCGTTLLSRLDDKERDAISWSCRDCTSAISLVISSPREAGRTSICRPSPRSKSASRSAQGGTTRGRSAISSIRPGSRDMCSTK
jgi:hypothetical protein